MQYRSRLLCLALLLSGASLSDAHPSFCGQHAQTIEVDVPYEGRPEDRPAKPITQMVTVIMDHDDPLRWYYFPNQLSLAKRPNGMPEFALIQYQLENPKTFVNVAGTSTEVTPPLPFLEGGVLQFSVTMDLSGIRDQLREKIAANVTQMTDPMTLKLKADAQLIKFAKGTKSKSNPNGSEDTIQVLKPITFDMVQVSAMAFDEIKVVGATAPGGTAFVSKAHVPVGVGPAYGTQKMPMTFELTRCGLPLLEALTTEAGTGVQVNYLASFSGILPPITFEVIVNWEDIFKHESNELKTKTSFAANIMGAVDVEAVATTSNKDIAQELISKGFIKIKILNAGDAFGDSYEDIDMTDYLDPLLDKIYEQIYDNGPDFEALTVDESAAAADPEKDAATIAEAREKEENEDGGGGGLIPSIKTEVSTAKLTIENVRKMDQTFTFEASSYQKRVATLGGFIGIGDYKATVKDEDGINGVKARTEMLKDERLVIVVNDASWDANYYSLPSVSDLNEKLKSISIGTSVIDHNNKRISIGSGERKQATWKQGQAAWSGDVTGDRISWPLLTVKQDHGDEDFGKFKYRVETRLRTLLDSKEMFYVIEVPLVTGSTSLSSPLTKLREVVVDSEFIFLEETEKYYVTVRCESKQLSDNGVEKDIRHSIRVTFPIKVATGQDPITAAIVLLPENATDITYECRLRTADKESLKLKSTPLGAREDEIAPERDDLE
jgi:hypothetical protein